MAEHDYAPSDLQQHQYAQRTRGLSATPDTKPSKRYTSMRLRSAALALAVLLGAAPLSHAQFFLSTGPVPIYGARFSYAAPFLGSPFFGSTAFGAYGYGYGGPLSGYRFGVLPRHARLVHSMWIFAPPTTTVPPPSPTPVDGSTIKVIAVKDGPDWTAQIKEAQSWQAELGGKKTPASDLVKLLTDALGKEVNVNDAFKRAACKDLGRIYHELAQSPSGTLNDAFALREKKLQGNTVVPRIPETTKAISTYLDQKFTAIDRGATLTGANQKTVTDTFQALSDALIGLFPGG
jgi:hypothetical protein